MRAAFLFLTLLAVHFTKSVYAATWDSDGTPEKIQALHDSSACHDGDTITFRSAKVTWTTGIKLTKRVTLAGNTTVSNVGAVTPGATPTPDVNDLSVIVDNCSAPAYPIRLGPGTRLTGLTFQGGTGTKNQPGQIQIYGDYTPSIRIDHCHFYHESYKNTYWGTGAYGVIDHCFFEQNATGGPANVETGGDRGNTPWADYPWLGTDKYVIIETCTIFGDGTVVTSGRLDGHMGGRYTVRYCYWRDATTGGHGTESGNIRSMRAQEVYRNTFHWTHNFKEGQVCRGGLHLSHDNTYLGTNPGHSVALNIYRARASGDGGQWRDCDGSSSWDKYDTDGHGGFTEGASAYVFESGTISATQPCGTMTDSTKSWTTNQWVGYTLFNTKMGRGSYVVSNTGTTISYMPYCATDRGPPLVFNAGDGYEFHKVFVCMDQNGAGRSDLVRTVSRKPINTRTNSAMWPRPSPEPCYSWNDKHMPDNVILGTIAGNGEPMLVKNRDYFDLGADPNALQTVKDYYTAARNGIQYNGDFTYPHPLVGGASPTATPAASPSATATATATATSTATPTATATFTPTPTLLRHLRRRRHLKKRLPLLRKVQPRQVVLQGEELPKTR